MENRVRGDLGASRPEGVATLIEEGSMSENTKAAFLRRFMEDESGISAVEYGLLAAGIAMGLWAFMGNIGGSLATIFGNIDADLATASGS